MSAIAAVAAAGAFAVPGSTAMPGSGGLDSIASASTNPAILAPPDAIVGEADGTVDFVVRLAEEGLNTVNVNYSAVTGTAGAGGSCNFDFKPASGTLTFSAGQVSKHVSVEINDCADVEGFEAFTLRLSSPVNGTIARASSRISIVDNDTVVTTPRIFARDAVVDEKDGTAFVPVLLGGPRGEASNSTVTVDYATSNGTATAGSDFTGVAGTLSFSPGTTSKTVEIPISDDGGSEGVEGFSLDLSSPSGATIADSSGSIQIGASDGIPSSQPSIFAPTDSIVGEGDGFVDLVVRLSQPGQNTVTVDYDDATSTAGGSTGCNFDYAPVSGELTFAPGETTKAVRVQILDCPDGEGFEAFTLGLSAAVNGAIARASGRVSIVDNDTVVATPRLFVRDAAVDEKDGFAYVSVLLGGPRGQASNSTVTVDYATSDGTATSGSDFGGVAGTLGFAPGETAKTVVVPIVDDEATEPVESFVLSLSNPTLATIVDSSGSVLIGAGDGIASSQPSIFAPTDSIVSEGDGFVDLVVHLSVPGQSPVSVHYATASNTAGGSTGCNFDYTPVSGELTFAPGETTKVVRVQVLDCADAEGLEAFTFALSAAVNGVIARASSRISIVDNDTVVATPRLFVGDAVVDEKDGFASVPVLLGGSRGQASNSVVTVDYATSEGTATAGADYTASSSTLSFAPGETAKTVSLAIDDDATLEGIESFKLDLSNPTNATIADSSGSILIGASDGIPSSQPSIFAPTDSIVGEGDGFVDLVVRLSQPGQNTVTVDYDDASSTAGGSTGCNFDYAPVSGALTFAPGETTKAVRVQILDCDDVERFEAFTLGLTSPVNGTIARASGRISIVDNDTVVATPKLAVRDAVVDEKDGFALVSVLLGGPGGESSNSTVTVDYATANGSASAGADYAAGSGTLSFAPGETAKTVVVPIADDEATEPVESFVLSLSNPTLATIADSSGSVLIGASDAGAIALPGLFAPPDVLVSEGAGYVDLVVDLSVPGVSPVSVHYATSNVTAGGSTGCNFDYTPVSGALNFALGETTKVVRVQILDCPNVEDPETFNFTISAPVNGLVSTATGKITICDNDGPVTLCAIAVTPANPSNLVGEDRQFTATGTYSDLSTADLTSQVTWASAITAVATISTGGLAHAVGGGTSTISATLGAISGSTLLTVNRLAQTITFGPLANKTYGDPDFAVGATASSGLPVSLAASGNCTVAGQTVHITGAGSCTITASQPGNASYLPAPSVSQTFAIAKATQTIAFAAIPNKTYGDPDFAVGATASSGLPVSFAASGNCTVAGQTVHITGAASCTITASQPGNANYLPAPSVSQTFAIAKATQTIAFPALPNRNQGDPDFNVSATASSGLPVTLAASGSCTVSGSRVHLTGPGACTITASQPGNADWNAAPPVARTFSIASPPPPPPPPPAGPPSPPPPAAPRQPAATPAPGPRDTELRYDPKRKVFLINVQYVLRNRSCRNPCPARAELRTRTGRRLYQVGKLPGDGRVVLGARRGIKIPRGRKIFFYIPIKLAQLRKVHFKTIRGYRYGETRLRVWLRTPAGEVLTVRDGRIRVSIARVRSGALPNLRGIL